MAAARVPEPLGSLVERSGWHAWGSPVILKQMLKYYRSAGEVDLLFQALADPTRRLMVDRLIEGPASVSELARPLAMSLPAVVQHLHVLEDSGLVRSEKLGRVRTASIQPMALRAAEQWIAQRRTAWERNLDRLGDYLAGEGDQAASHDKTTQRRGR